MESLDKSHHVDLESGGGGGVGGGCRRSTAVNDGGSSSSDEGDGHSSIEEHRELGQSGTEIVRALDKRRESSVSECSVEVVDLEAGERETKIQLSKSEKDCRICHLSMDASNQESGIPIELGCSCKDDLAAAHKQCAETWFKIKGNKTCEICGSIARNVAGVSEAELSDNDDAAAAADNTPPPPAETRNFWQGHRFLNFLLACMVFAFVISWLFHFNVPA